MATKSFEKCNLTTRDDAVKINWDNIKLFAKSQFRKEPESSSLGSAYDYYSLMHYGKFDFSRNGGQTISPTKEVKENGGCKKVGQRCGMSREDVRQINKLYKCDEMLFGRDDFDGCLDVRPSVWCRSHSWACGDARYPGFREGCQKTCDLCGFPICDNEFDECDSYGWACRDDRFPWFKNVCQKTCGRC